MTDRGNLAEVYGDDPVFQKYVDDKVSGRSTDAKDKAAPAVPDEKPA